MRLTVLLLATLAAGCSWDNYSAYSPDPAPRDAFGRTASDRMMIQGAALMRGPTASQGFMNGTNALAGLPPPPPQYVPTAPPILPITTNCLNMGGGGFSCTSF